MLCSYKLKSSEYLFLKNTKLNEKHLLLSMVAHTVNLGGRNRQISVSLRLTGAKQ